MVVTVTVGLLQERSSVRVQLIGAEDAPRLDVGKKHAPSRFSFSGYFNGFFLAKYYNEVRD